MKSASLLTDGHLFWMQMTAISARMRRAGQDRGALARSGAKNAWAGDRSGPFGQQREKLGTQAFVLEKRAAHHAVDHLRLIVLDAAPMHAEMIGFEHEGHPLGREPGLQQI